MERSLLCVRCAQLSNRTFLLQSWGHKEGMLKTSSAFTRVRKSAKCEY